MTGAKVTILTRPQAFGASTNNTLQVAGCRSLGTGMPQVFENITLDANTLKLISQLIERCGAPMAPLQTPLQGLRWTWS